MAIIYQPTLFLWKDSHEIGDLERFKAVMETLPDENLIVKLEARRGNGRNDYPIRAVWNSLIAKILFQHPSIASLIRELHRNAQLREICGFNPLKGIAAIPDKDVYSRFLIGLEEYQDDIDTIFNKLVQIACEEFPDFGKNLSLDSEAIETHISGKGKFDQNKEERAKSTDRRGDALADWGKKYSYSNDHGKKKKITKTWYGYKVHLAVDATYELPVAYTVTKASRHDSPEAHEMIRALAYLQPEILLRCKYLTADRAYDDTKFIKGLWDQYGIKSVIDTRDMWQKDKERQLKSHPDIDNITYNQRGELYCSCPKTGERWLMPLGGFEHDRQSIKFRCPASHYGMLCPGKNQCSASRGIRIPLSENYRIFTTVPRNSRNWSTTYATRTTVERVFSRLDTSYGFDHIKIKGLARVRQMAAMSLIVMLSLAIARSRRQQVDKIRSLVEPL